jgi:hypothetical protein
VIDDTVIAVESADDEVLDGVRRRLAMHAALPRPAHIRLRYLRGSPSAAAAVGQTVYESKLGPVTYRAQADILQLSGDTFALSCNCSTREATVVIDPASKDGEWLGCRPLLTFSLLELLRRRNAFPVHAAAVERDGQAIVIAGGSGSGKSTFALELALNGYSFMCDDLVLVRLGQRGARLHGLCEELDLTPWSAAALPELGIDVELEPGWAKHRVRPSEVFGNRISRSAAPSILLFPRIEAAGAVPRATALTAGEALVRLAPDMLLTDRLTVEQHFAALNKLVEASRSYEVAVGDDLDAALTMVESLRR